ncbi:hypothetical protein [Brachyspira hyodysenteriae]|uniref:hypothetical protein n=2 Tax=Brachyspira hyodysenteriae TaxID=159 RepID=UPI0022CDBDDE|nr:hypothetical protein [Brachyspira hyodysenteriae]MDA0023721.1 hypothetical protein [Brachyspira hyodysenteriae]
MKKFMNDNGFKTLKTFYAGFPFYSHLGRYWLNKNFTLHNESSLWKFSIKQKNNIVYILLRYFSFKNIGDQFMGIFERADMNN